MSRRHGASRRWWVPAVLLALALASASIAVAAHQVGYWLVVEDPLRRAATVVVLGGDFPFRAVEAADLYRRGWAPEVWLTRPSNPEQEAALARLGLPGSGGEERGNAAVLERLGVPAGAIRVLPARVLNTAQEVGAVARELTGQGGTVAILVTSKPHSRRVRSTWRAVVGSGPGVIVRYPAADAFDAGGWWHNTRDALAVSREVFGLVNVWAGFPVRVDRPPG